MSETYQPNNKLPAAEVSLTIDQAVIVNQLWHLADKSGIAVAQFR